MKIITRHHQIHANREKSKNVGVALNVISSSMFIPNGKYVRCSLLRETSTGNGLDSISMYVSAVAVCVMYYNITNRLLSGCSDFNSP